MSAMRREAKVQAARSCWRVGRLARLGRGIGAQTIVWLTDHTTESNPFRNRRSRA